MVIGAYGAFKVERANRSWLSDALREALEGQAGTIVSGQQAEQTDPDATINIDLESKVVAVDSTADDESLRQAMRSAGYEAEPIA